MPHSSQPQAKDEGLLHLLLQHHLRVRNEIYRYPLSQERMAAIDRGEFVPEPIVVPSAH